LKGDIDNTPVHAGMAAGRTHDIPKVEELILRVIKEAEEIIKKLPSKLV
jgi:hypothetical protein